MVITVGRQYGSGGREIGEAVAKKLGLPCYDKCLITQAAQKSGLPEGIVAKIEKKAVPVPPVFDLIAKTGKIPERDMYNTFNMGAGLVLAVAAEDVSRAVAAISAAGETAFVIGECTAGAEKGVELV